MDLDYNIEGGDFTHAWSGAIHAIIPPDQIQITITSYPGSGTALKIVNQIKR